MVVFMGGDRHVHRHCAAAADISAQRPGQIAQLATGYCARTAFPFITRACRSQLAARLRCMSEKPESDEFEEEDAEDTAPGGEDVDVDHIMRDVDSQRRRAPKGAEPAWRRLERVMEERRTAELHERLRRLRDCGRGRRGLRRPERVRRTPESGSRRPAQEEEIPLALPGRIPWISLPLDLVALRKLPDVIRRAKRQRLNRHGRLAPARRSRNSIRRTETDSAHRACDGTCRPPKSWDRCPSAPCPANAPRPRSPSIASRQIFCAPAASQDLVGAVLEELRRGHIVRMILVGHADGGYAPGVLEQSGRC